MATPLQDLRYGLRMLAKNPGFTAVAVVTLALGIGANTATFSIVDAVLLRPLPYKNADRLMMIWETHSAIPKLQVALPDFLDWRMQNDVFDQMGAYSLPGQKRVNLTGVGEPEELQATLTSASLFPLLGVKPRFGRSFLPQEDTPGPERVVILSYDLWQRRFGSDPNIIGTAVTLGSERYAVVGVMPRGFRLPAWADLWMPLGLLDRAEFTNRKHHPLEVIACLNPGVKPEQAQAELQTIARRLQQQYPATNNGIGVLLIPLQQELAGNLRLALWVLLGTVGLVLLIACGNIANLFLARAATREKEIAIRTALGAARGRLIRQLLTESAMLATTGGALGLLASLLALDLIRAHVPENVLRTESISIDVRVLIFTAVVSVLTGVMFGLAPACHTTNVHLNDSLKEGGRSSRVGSRGRLRGFLVISEVALALVVLISAGLLVKSFRQLLEADLGFNPHSVLTMQIALPESKDATAFYEQLLPRIDALPGVQLAAMIDVLPLASDAYRTRFAVEGAPAPEPGKYPVCQTRTVSLDYFRVMEIPLLRGRFFTQADVGKPLIIINQRMARRYFPNQDPVGKRLIMGVLDPKPSTIPVIGVVADSRDLRPYAEAEPEIYWAWANNLSSLVIRTASDPLRSAAAVRHEVLAVDKDQPIYQVRTMDQILSDSLSSRRFSMLLLGIFAVVALVLAAVGLYGVMSYTVTERTHEIGIRMALGAQRRDVLGLVVGQGMVLTLVGVGIGWAGALAVTRALSSMLYNVGATDPLTFAEVSLLVVAVALAASYIPGRRVTKVDPMGALRYE